MKNALNKNIFNALKKSFTRALSIGLMVALGSSVVVGLMITGPSMRESLDDFLDKTNMQDISVESTYGLNFEDVSAIKSLTQDMTLEFSHYQDAYVEGSDSIIRLESDSSSMPKYLLKEGRLPENENEIALDRTVKNLKFKIGDRINLKLAGSINIEDKLKNTSYIVVGLIDSPEYLMESSKGISLIGKTSLDGFGLIKEANFLSSDYQIARIKSKELSSYKKTDKVYEEKARELKFQLLDILETRPEDRLDKIKKEAEEKIKEAKDRISSGKEELEGQEEKLNEAKTKLNQALTDYLNGKEEFLSKKSLAEKEIIDNEKSLILAKEKLEDGKKELHQSKKTFSIESENAFKKIDYAKKELEKAKEEYLIGLAAFNKSKEEFEKKIELPKKKLEDGKKELDKAKDELDQAYKKLENEKNVFEENIKNIENELNDKEKSLKNQLSSIPTRLEELKAAKASLENEIENTSTLLNDFNSKKDGLIEKQKQVQNDLEKETDPEKKSILQDELDKINRELENGKELETKLNSIKSQLEDTVKQINEIDNSKVSIEETLKQVEASKKELESKKNQGYSSLKENQDKLDLARKEYEKNLSTYEKNKENFEKEIKPAKDKLDQAELKISSSEAKFKQGEKDYQSALSSLEKEKEAVNKRFKEAEEDLTKGQAEYDEGIKKISQAKIELNQKSRETEVKLEEAYSDILKGEKDYEDGVNKLLEEKPNILKDLEKGSKEIKEKESDIFRLKLPSYTVKTLDDQNGIYLYLTNSKRMDLLSLIFPIFFYLIAILVTTSTMSRMVDEERTEIGTLKALGYSSTSISKKYLIYALIPSLIGCILGISFGHSYLTKTIYKAYSTGFAIGEQVVSPYWLIILLATFISLTLIFATAYFTSLKSLKNNAANLLRPKAPRAGSRILLENVDFIWEKLSFLQKVTMRNIFRYKGRMTMTIIGVAGCCSLLFMGYSIKDSIVQISEKQYSDIIHYDLLPILDDKLDRGEYEKFEKSLEENPDINSKLGIRFDIGKVEFKDEPDLDLYIITSDENLKLKEFISLRNRKNNKSISSNDQGIVITEKLAQVLNLKTGNSLKLKDQDGKEREFKIGQITENYINHYIYLNKEEYKEAFGTEAKNNAFLVKIKNVDKESNKKVFDSLIEQKNILSVMNMKDVNEQVSKLLESLNMVVAIIIGISSMLAIIVLYNLTNINVSERLRELSTIKVLGFYPKEVTSYVYRESGFLTLLGILLGYILGKILHWFIINVIAPKEIMMVPKILLSNYLKSFAMTMVLSLIVMLIMHFKLKKVNMVEALKAVE